MVHKIRKDPMTFHKYWHNKDLVNFLNMFVNSEEDLPGNWQMKHDKTGKVGSYFLLDYFVGIVHWNSALEQCIETVRLNSALK